MEVVKSAWMRRLLNRQSRTQTLCTGRRKGLGTCLHSSCSHGMQLRVVISNLLRYMCTITVDLLIALLGFCQTLTDNAVQHSDRPCLVAGYTESLEKNHFPDVIHNQRF